ncbi:MAG: amylo-alpha-1,6-glucosidase [bacterium]
MLDNLKAEVRNMGKLKWRAMLLYVAELHERSIHPPRDPFHLPWEEIGPGYCYGPAFGHWDIVHAILDTMPSEPQHAMNQILNNLSAQQPDGLVPGVIWMHGERPRWNTKVGHPPLWQIAVQDYCDTIGGNDLIERCYGPLVRLIGWYEKNRKAEGKGFYYIDILNRLWESGVDEGVRFDDVPTEPLACVDATSHVYALYDYAARWSMLLGRDAKTFSERADDLRSFIQNELFDEETGFFHDIWSVGRPKRRPLAFEGMWPVVVGAATREQANRAIDENLLEPKRFLSKHPIATVGLSDPRFELRCWRGPAWNSMTYWAARGCIRYGRPDAARRLLEGALDASATQFERTGTIWEFYHPHGGDPRELQRKPQTEYNTPCRDYLGHNPLIAMARLWGSTGEGQR